MKPAGILTLALAAFALIPGTILAASFGAVTLQPGASKSVTLGVASRNLRVCNDSGSAGAVLVTIGGNAPHYLSSGLCAEDIGDRLTIQSLAAGPATVDYKATCDGSSMN
jgi:hypothetical protein